MSNRKLTILLLIAVLAISSFAIDVDVFAEGQSENRSEAHSEIPGCQHDHQEEIEPDFIDVEEEDLGNAETAESNRTLATYPDLRIYPYYSLNAGTAMNTYISGSLMPPVVEYFSKALKNRYPVSGKIIFSGSKSCGISTPTVLRNGVATDIVWVVVTDSSSSYVANSYTCTLSGSSKRPLAGQTTISTAFVKSTTDVLVHEKNMICMMHEFTHVLGFSKSMYSHWIDLNGKTLSGHIKSATLDGLTSIVIDVPAITNRLRTHFGCSTLKGAYMENTGGSATGGSHFERRHFGMEAMTSGLLFQQDYSEFSLAMMESTGWYVPDYSYADNYFWGKYQGCGFLTGSCTSSVPEWCSSSARSCTHPGRGGGACGSDSRSDGCKYMIPKESYDCEYSGASSYARLPGLQQFGRTAGSKCFTGTLSTSSGAAQTTYCFKPTCTGSGKSYTLTLNIGGKSVSCPKKGAISVSGYKGVINCPDPYIFCTSVGAAICPRGCMGRGTCVSGQCKCNSGYTGKDCAMKA